MRRIILPLALLATSAKATITPCRAGYKPCPVQPTQYVYKAPIKKNHLSFLGGGGYMRDNYEVTWTEENAEVKNYYAAIGGIMYQRRVGDSASMSFLAFTNLTAAVGIGFDW